MPENNLRQAQVPVGASLIAQQPGTAPGLVCPVVHHEGTKVIYVVPGVPYEMKEMVCRARSSPTSSAGRGSPPSSGLGRSAPGG